MSARRLFAGRCGLLLGALGLTLVCMLPAHAAEEMFRLREPGESLHTMTLNDLAGVSHTVDPSSAGKPTGYGAGFIISAVLVYGWRFIRIVRHGLPEDVPGDNLEGDAS